MPPKKQLLFLGGTLIVLGFFVLRSQSRKLELKSSNEAVEVSSSKPLGIVPISPNNSTQPSSIESAKIQTWAKWEIQEKNLGMRGLELPKDGQKSILNVEIKVKPSCTPGDADAIDMDLKATPLNQLLGTLEGMSAGTESFTWQIPKDLLTNGTVKQQFKLTTNDKPTQYGFYLCTAGPSDRTCQDKKVRDINEIFTEHLKKEGKPGQEKRVIFYQYLLVDDRGISFFEEIPRGDQKIRELKDYAKERNFVGTKVEEGIERAREGLQTLRSLPVQIEKDTLVLELPKYDAAACAQQQREKQSQRKKL